MTRHRYVRSIGLQMVAGSLFGAPCPATAQAEKIADVQYPISVSPDGRFVSTFGAGGNLAIHDLETGEARTLTRSRLPQLVMNAVFSPDGSRIAYAWHNEDDYDDLRVIGVDGNEPRVLHRDSTVRSVWTKDWSPDGERILVTILRKDGTREIALVAASGGEPRALVPPGPATGVRPEAMAFSPSGRFIAFDERVAAGPGGGPTEAANHDIFLLASDGSALKPLIEHPADDRLLGWSVDGEAIIFASDRSGTVDVWLQPLLVDAARGEPRLLERDVGQLTPLGMSRGSFFFGVTECDCSLQIADLHPETGQITGQPETIAPAVHNTGADWSPDGSWLAWVEPETGVLPSSPGIVQSRAVLVARSLETGEERRRPLEVDVLHQLRPLWSPDGRRVMVKGWDRDAYPREIVVGISVEDDEAETMVASESVWRRLLDWLDWSADGNALFYTDLAADGTIRIFTRELAAGDERELLGHRPPPFVYGLTASPDGQSLAFGLWDTRRRRSSLVVMSLSSDDRETLVDLAFPAAVGPPAWYPDSRHLLYLAEDALWRIRIEGGEPTRLGTLTPGYNQAGVTIHPDATRLAYVAETESRTEIWAIENIAAPGEPRNER